MDRRRKCPLGTARNVHWWNDEVVSCRRETIAWRRKLTRFRTKHKSDRNDEIEAAYSVSRRRTRDAILKAKRKSWQKLLDGIENCSENP